MFEKIGRAAEKAATSVSMSRRGFFGRFTRLAGGAALGAAALLTFSQRADAAGRGCKCSKPYCGCSPGDVSCIQSCLTYEGCKSCG
jgi:hypothetical protein